MRKVMVVDDKEGIRTLLKEVLQEEGYQVEEAANGWDALESVRKTKYDLILLDVKIPGINGVEVLKKMRAEDIMTRVMIMTAYEEMNTYGDLKELGVSQVFSKPFDIREVLRKVNQHMAARE
ncbi:response regulator [Natribacillus halophilus]|uniref:Two-component system, response regulator, stage 0 sporulation protein F n=1 Tax=Natribacillus halophilus TaxID=549003 RepID=A0A1G8KWZ0_9BACI|nr:response regulator [Natribacillus halophilus]SDI47430.1 two-component system, response regulator, stage 0 sporulation protein F [Natribacillus halophilus]